MEKYTFEIKKITTKQIEIESENKQETLKKLLGFMVKKDIIQFLLSENNIEIPKENIKIRCKKCR